MAFFLIIGIIITPVVGGYFYWRLGKVMAFYGVNIKRKWNRLLRIFLGALMGYLSWNVWSARAVVVLHLLALFLVVDLAWFLLRFLLKNHNNNKIIPTLAKVHGSGVLPVALLALILGAGYWNMGHLHQTSYRVSSRKLSEDYRVVLLTDTHYGTIQDTEVLKGKISEINELEPDLVLLGGDIVEEGTSGEDMREAFQVLGGLESRFGTYYVYGNHDRQPYSATKTYTEQELEEAIRENGIQILQDSYVEIAEDLILAGREDASRRGEFSRASSQEVLEGADREKYIIMLDHQPIDGEENNKAGVNLELSGHTHGGQIWPIGWVSQLTGVLNYGEYQKGDCMVIVSSGVAGWGYPIRTEAKCEYVVIDLEKSE